VVVVVVVVVVVAVVFQYESDVLVVLEVSFT